jgi:hypothetical protein
MDTQRVTLAKVSGALLVALSLNGCLANPLAVDPRALGIGSPTTPDVTPALETSSAPLTTKPGTTLPGGDPNERKASALIDGSRGGTVRAGEWTVRIPRGAFSGTGTVTVTVDANDPATVGLEVQPAALNQFRVPVQLRYKTKTHSQALKLQIEWWNPSRRSWQAISSQADYSDAARVSSLTHFSFYRCRPKAGW